MSSVNVAKGEGESVWALVTGGAKRLGAALCVALAEQGHAVAVHYNGSAQEAREVVAACRAVGGEAAAIQGDFTSVAGVELFLQHYLRDFSETAVLINNVGEYCIASALETSTEEWTSLFQINLHTPFMLSRALIPALIRHRGHILNIGVAGLHRRAAHTYSTAYTLTKQSLWGLTLSLAREVAPKGVRVNMVSPGQLDISRDRWTLPMERPAHCREVCRVVNFLLDRESAYITGQNIEVAGGLGLA